MADVEYINGIVATMEKRLLKDKLLRCAEQTPEEAYRTLTESGYGLGVLNDRGLYGYENLIEAEERSLDAFIRECAPSKAELFYLLAPRDFHNAKALIKAKYLGGSAQSMLAPEGLVPLATLNKAVTENVFDGIYPELKCAIQEANELISSEESTPTGAETGVIFEKALYSALKKNVKRGLLKRTIIARADMLNILIAFRSQSVQEAEKSFVDGGKLTKKQLSVILVGDGVKICSTFALTPYSEFVNKCLECRENKVPFSDAEKQVASLERSQLEKNKYDLENNEPFLYYVFRRRAENADVRIVFVCLLAGMNETQIKKRLRSVL